MSDFDTHKPLFGRDCHIVRDRDQSLAFDVESLCVSPISSLEQDVLRLCDGRIGTEIIDDACRLYAREEIQSALRRLSDRVLIQKEPQKTEFPTSTDVPSIIHLNLQVTHDCNMTCEYCYLRDVLRKSRPLYMNESVGRRVVNFLLDALGETPCGYMSLGGGEPTLNMPFIRRIVQYGHQRAAETGKTIRFDLHTNGLLLHEYDIQSLDRSDVFIQVSIDGLPDVHNTLRKGDKEQETQIYSLATLKALQRLGAKPFGIRCVFTDRDLSWSRQLKYLVTQAPQVQRIDMNCVVMDTEALNTTPTNLVQVFSNLRQYIQAHILTRGTIWFGAFEDAIARIALKLKRESACGGGITSMTVGPNGDLYPCPMFANQKSANWGTIFQNSDFQGMASWFSQDESRVEAQWFRYLRGFPCAYQTFLLSRENATGNPVFNRISEMWYEQAILAYAYFQDHAPEILQSRYRAPIPSEFCMVAV